MRRLKRPAVLLLLVAMMSLVGAAADKAKGLYNQGQDAEARQNYESAYDFYKQAYDLKPKDLRYRAAFERSRFLAASSHVHRGQKLRDDGNMDEAVAEFRKALDIDPSLFIAKQELNRTLKIINDARVLVEHELPHLSGDDGDHRPGNEHGSASQATALEV